MKAIAKALTCSTLVIALCSVVVFCQQPEIKSESNQHGSTTEVAEESRLNASLIELYKLGKFDEALLVGKHLLELRQKMFGLESPVVARALSDLAEIYHAKKKYDEAKPLYLRILTILERNPTANPQLLSNALERLAYIQFTIRDYQDASGFLERALAVKGAALGKDNPSLAPLLHDLANVYQMQRRFDRAEPLYLRSLAMTEQRLGRTNPETISLMKDYACLNLRSSNPSAKPPKEEKEGDEREKARKAIADRASCWLYGFKDDCATDPPTENQETDRVLNGRAILLPKPDYPVRAQKGRAGGRVFVAVRINEGGNVVEAKTVCGGPPLLFGSALTAARGAKFTPTVIDGKPKQVYGVITYNFVLQ